MSYSVVQLAHLAKTNDGYRAAVKDYLKTTGRFLEQQVGVKRKLVYKWDKSEDGNGPFSTFKNFADLFTCIYDTNADVWNEMPMVNSGRLRACMPACLNA